MLDVPGEIVQSPQWITSFWSMCQMIYSFYQNSSNEMFLISLVAFQLWSSLSKNCGDIWWLSRVLTTEEGINEMFRLTILHTQLFTLVSLCLVPKLITFYNSSNNLLIFVECFHRFDSDVHMTTGGWTGGRWGSRQHQTLYMQHLQYSNIQTDRFNQGVAGFVFGGEMNPHYSQYITIKWIFKESVSSSQAAGREYIKC